MRSKTLLLVAGVAGALAVCGFVGLPQDGFLRERKGANAEAKNALEGKEPPAMEFSEWLNTEGKSLSWKDLKGKVVLVDFWAHWCGPCRASVPHMKELYKRYKAQGFVIIGVHSDKEADKMRASVKELGMPWPIAQDGDRKVMRAFEGDSYPDYYLIDRSGKVRFADLANSEVDRAVKLLIEEK